ncbi:hypothetical protein MRX96_055294 [Rhipicephalus microplus]
MSSEMEFFITVIIGMGRACLLCRYIDMRQSVLFMCHDASTAGHFEQHKTLALTKKRFWWRRLHSDISRYVLSRTVCQARKATTNPQTVPMQCSPPPETPFAILGLDHLGPFPRMSRGNKFLTAATDCLTEWTEVRVAPDSSTLHVLTFINKCVIFLTRHATLGHH